MIAEKLEILEENLELPNETINVRNYILNRYPELKDMSFSIAIDHELQDEIVNGLASEIALLPPFAGG